MEESKFSARRWLVERIPRLRHETHKGLRFHHIEIIEKLECGHQVQIFWQGDPLIARWRHCKECAAKQLADTASPPKKPAQSERFIPHWRRTPPGEIA